MNANELADELEDKDRLWNVDENLMIKTCAMLRQQQAEIEALKKEATLQRLSDFTQEAEKTLTDEEIEDIWAGISTGDDVVDMHLFARAILRKAQKK